MVMQELRCGVCGRAVTGTEMVICPSCGVPLPAMPAQAEDVTSSQVATEAAPRALPDESVEPAVSQEPAPAETVEEIQHEEVYVSGPEEVAANAYEAVSVASPAGTLAVATMESAPEPPLPTDSSFTRDANTAVAALAAAAEYVPSDSDSAARTASDNHGRASAADAPSGEAGWVITGIVFFLLALLVTGWVLWYPYGMPLP